MASPARARDAGAQETSRRSAHAAPFPAAGFLGGAAEVLSTCPPRAASPRRPRARRARPWATGACLFAAATSLLGCGSDTGSPDAVPPPTATVEPAPAPAARRPTRRFYLARTPERCEIFAEDGESRTEPFATPCPEYMLTGERIRVAGRTCFLDNKAQPEREKPVVCPDPLTRFEKRERGEEK